MRLSIGDVTVVPDVFDIFVDKIEERDTDVKVLDVLDRLVVVTLPPIWPAEEEFFRISPLSHTVDTSSTTAESSAEAAAFVVEHEKVKE